MSGSGMITPMLATHSNRRFSCKGIFRVSGRFVGADFGFHDGSVDSDDVFIAMVFLFFARQLKIPSRPSYRHDAVARYQLLKKSSNIALFFSFIHIIDRFFCKRLVLAVHQSYASAAVRPSFREVDEVFLLQLRHMASEVS